MVLKSVFADQTPMYKLNSEISHSIHTSQNISVLEDLLVLVVV